MATLAGRAFAVAVVEGALDDAIAGSGRLVLLRGEAGIGKSMVADVAADLAADRGVPVRRGYAVDDEGAPALWPWIRIAQGPGGLREPMTSSHYPSDSSARFQMFVDMTDRLRLLSADQGLVLVLEDMHWADRTSILLLQHLSRELPAMRLLVIATLRDRPESAMTAAAAELVRSRATRELTLAGLQAPDVAEWLRDMGIGQSPGTVELLCQRTNGNPLLIRMLATALTPDARTVDRAALEQLLVDRPDVRVLVTRQLELLSRPARDLVVAAAVLAERIMPDVLAAVVDADPTAVDGLLSEAIAAGVLRPGVPGPAFSHALIRDAVGALLPPTERRDLHHRSAVALASVGDPTLAGVIAVHWRNAGSTDGLGKAVVWARRAAEDAHQRLAFDEEVRFLQLAVDSAAEHQDGPAVLAPLMVRLANAAFFANRTSLSFQACRDAADLAEQAGLPDVLAEAALVVQGVGGLGIGRLIRGLCLRALRVLPADRPVVRARLLAQLATTTAEDGDGPSARKLAVEALSLAESCGDDSAVLESIAALHLTLGMIETVDERMVLANRAIELGARLGSPMGVLWGHLWRVEASLQTGDLVDVDRQLALIDDIATHRHLLIARWHHHRLMATRTTLAGDFAVALRHIECVRDLARTMGDSTTSVMYQAFLCQLSVIRGVAVPLELRIVEVLQNAPPIPIARISLPIQLALQGDLDAARSAFEEFRALPQTLPQGLRWAGTITQIGTAAILLEDADVANQVYEVLLPSAGYCTGDGSGAVISFGSNALQLGDLAMIAGRADRALAHYAAAIPVNARLGARPFLALSRLGWARAVHTLISSGHPMGVTDDDVGTARRFAISAAAEFDRLDMPGPLTAARRLSSQLGEDRSRSTPETLSGRELEVVELVAQALSNRDIARRLFLSERTVESHVRAVLRKLGFSTRTEIATWSIRQLSAGSDR